jgi:predicted metal-dependent hydrolase
LGIEKFNAGEYYAQHDLLEAQWMAEIRPIRDLYRAILQVGVAYYHITRGNYRGAHKMLLRSVQWLAILPDVCQGVDIRQLREDSAQVRAALETLPEGASFDITFLRPVRLVAD